MQCHRYASECKRGCGSTCVMKNSYRPSNGTEGMGFTEMYCMNCLHCDPDSNGKKQCDILLSTMCFYPTEPEYPMEWIYDPLGHPKCTKYVHWDWDQNGDPDDPDNPNKPPDPPDPNQLHLFPTYPDERHYQVVEQQKIMA